MESGPAYHTVCRSVTPYYPHTCLAYSVILKKCTLPQTKRSTIIRNLVQLNFKQIQTQTKYIKEISSFNYACQNRTKQQELYVYIKIHPYMHHHSYIHIKIHRNISCFDSLRYCSLDHCLECLKAVLVPQTKLFLFMCCCTELKGSTTELR